LLARLTAVGEFVASVVLYTMPTGDLDGDLAQLRALAFGTAAAYSVLLILLVLLMTLVPDLSKRACLRCRCLRAS